jgi:Ca-activated chloride channel family protein
MHHPMPKTKLFIWFFLFLNIGTSLFSQTETSEDRIESSYFMVNGELATDLPLVSVHADVLISGMIAEVTVTQTFVNKGKDPIEATYVFPGSSKSAVYGMQMTIGSRIIKAEIKEKEEAEKEFEEAKEAGKTASLLQQFRPNVFQMNVANILPDDRIEVELKYTELLVPVEGVYEYVFPTEVADRYDQAGDAPASGPAPPAFQMNLKLAAGMPISQANCLSHETEIFYERGDRLTLKLKDENQRGGSDFVFAYRLSGDGIGSGISLYEGENENFFLLQLQPPKAVAPEAVLPREYIFIVDVSGSMDGFPIETGKALMSNLLGDLREDDRFNLILFASGYDTFSKKSVPATDKNLNDAFEMIEDHSGSGGTNLLPALEEVLNMPRIDGYTRTVVAVTDGLITVEREAFELIRRNLGEANFFTFGIGKNMNRHLVEGMSFAGQGEPIFIITEEEAESKAQQFRRYIESPVLTDIEVDFGEMEVYDISPLSIPDVFAERPVIVFGKYKGQPDGRISLLGNSGEYRYNHNLDLSGIQPSNDHSPLRYLWARDKIKTLSDFVPEKQRTEEEIKEITDLGLKYNLLTEYTSFIAVDNQVRLDNEELSFSGTYGAVPEPHEWALIGLVIALITFMLYRNGWKW